MTPPRARSIKTNGPTLDTKRTGRELAPGAILLVPLADGTYAYGHVVNAPDIAFYNLNTAEPELDIDAIMSTDLIFSVSVLKYAAREWRTIGHAPLPDPLPFSLERFVQDPDDPSQCTIIDAQENERPATVEECALLERESAWDGPHVAARLQSFFRGEPDETFESLRPIDPKTRR